MQNLEVLLNIGRFNLMPIRGTKKRFTDKNISNSPTDSGVYALYRYNELIYIGMGDSVGGIKSRLQSHKKGYEGKCTQNATSYKRERHSDPETREIHLQEEYIRAYGKLPRCNDRVG